jgi:sortase (surface protein transpeptidase)
MSADRPRDPHAVLTLPSSLAITIASALGGRTTIAAATALVLLVAVASGLGSVGLRPAAAASAPRKQLPAPVRISIPAIGVNARVIPLGLNPDRTMQVPTNLSDTGWFRPAPEPGEVGAAVIVGHLNSRTGPGVFARLSRLRTGSVISIRLQGGSTVRFVARSTMRVPKNRFPTNLVYAKTPRPTLRLITCAGRLNAATGRHNDNYIVFAALLSGPR